MAAVELVPTVPVVVVDSAVADASVVVNSATVDDSAVVDSGVVGASVVPIVSVAVGVGVAAKRSNPFVCLVFQEFCLTQNQHCE